MGDWPRNIPWTVLRKEHSLRYLTAIYGRQAAREFVRRHQGEDDVALAGTAIQIATLETMRGEQEISTHEAMVESLALWDRIHTFVFSPALVAALRETDPGKIDEGFLRLPFRWIYLDIGLNPIMVPEANVPRWATRNTEVRGYILTDYHPARGIVGYLVMHSPQAVDTATGDQAPWNLVPFSLNKAIEFAGDIFDPEGSDEETTLAFGRSVMRLAVNALKYINCVNAEIREERLRNPNVPDPHGRVFPKDVAGKSDEGGTVRRCGFYIRLPSIGSGGGGGVESGRKIEVRFLVRGHFHHFWTGPRDGERKLITRWVEPFWKGPDAAEQAHQKMYKVESK